MPSKHKAKAKPPVLPDKSSLPPSPPSAPRSPVVIPSGALAPAASISSASSSSSGGSGRGRKLGRNGGATTPGGSVQARRSAASLGLGVQFANMNDLTSPARSTTSSNPSTSTPSSSTSASPSRSPQRSTYSPPRSRRASLQFAAVAGPPVTPSMGGSASPNTPLPPPPGLGFPQQQSTPLSSVAENEALPDNPPFSLPGAAPPSNGPSRRPSMTHLASFLSGIQHHTRVRSPGVHGGRGVSRSASRSHSRAGEGRAAGGSGRYGSGGESDFGGAGEFSDAESDAGVGSEFSFFGGFGGGLGSVSRQNSRRRPGPGGGSLSRASSVRSGRSRASSISVASSSGSGAQHPLLHELVRENTTGGVIPSPPPAAPLDIPVPVPLSAPSLSHSVASTATDVSGFDFGTTPTPSTLFPPQPPPPNPHPDRGPNVVTSTSAHPGQAAAGTVRPETWEATFETYKPGIIAAPRGGLKTPLDEEPFLDSAPNSPEVADAQAPGPTSTGGLMRMKRTGTYSSFASTASSALQRTSSALSSVTNDLSTVDVFDEGERVGVGVWLEGRGGWVRDIFAGEAEIGLGGAGGEGSELVEMAKEKGPGNGLDGPRQLEVERRLGEGTYAIVYLVREVLYDPDPNDDDDILSPIDPLASFEFDEPSASGGRPRLHSWASDYYAPRQATPTYGQYFALKCLCKKNLTDELIEVQRNEAFLHRALPKHENVVQMYGAYETDDWLFLVLEYAGGRDAFYWLLEAQEHGTEDLYSRAASPSSDGGLGGRRRSSYDFDVSTSTVVASLARSVSSELDDSALSRTITADTPAHLLSVSVEETPPSPSLLSAAVGDALLSRKRLRLISRMFGQMCAAVQACHDVGISHRDIKPENFIVIDGKGDRGGKALVKADGAEGSKGVVVKITDWGLGTMEDECEDFDCGSKPYMAYECRNNLRPTYDPRQADVWSLGLVFLNLLYHRNPWADPSLDDPDFAEYVEDPIGFLQNRFEGMSDEVATFLAEKVFCDVLEVVDGKARRRVSAGEFGQWASRLVIMLGGGGANSPFSPGLGNFSLHGTGGPNGYPRPPFSHIDSTASSNFDFSPVVTMPLHIGPQASPTPGAAHIPPTASLLSQHFAPSTLKQSSVLSTVDDLPPVPEIPDIPTPALAHQPTRPAYISSPTALSEDGESLPSPTFPSPPPPPPPASAFSPPSSVHASPERTFIRMPWSSPTLGTATVPPPSLPPSTHVSPSGTPASLSKAASPSLSPSQLPSPLPLASGISLLAARRPSLLDSAAAKNDSHLSTTSTVMPGGAGESLPPSPPNGAVSASTSAEAGFARLAVAGPRTEKEQDVDETEKDPPELGSDEAKNGEKDEGDEEQERAAKQATSPGHGAASPPIPLSPPRGKLPTLAEGESDCGRTVLDDLAAASQELARELSSARSGTSSIGSSSKPTRPRPVPSSGSHGTKSTSALPFTLSSTPSPHLPPAPASPAKKSGMFGRLKTLVNEGNSDLEAFKRRVDERNASIGATSAPAKMQHPPGSKVPKGKFDSPFSSRGSVGTASWGSAADGGDEAAVATSSRGRGGGTAGSDVGKDHWSSASSRRDRLADRRGQGRPPAGAGRDSDFAPSSSSTRGGASALSAFESSRNGTPLSSFGSVGSDWRSGSHSRGRPAAEAGLAPPLPVSPPPQRPKLKDAATDTSDLGSPPRLPSPPSVPVPSASLAQPPAQRPLPSPALSAASIPSSATAKSSPRPLADSLPSASPVLSPAAATASLPAGSPAGAPGKSGNKLAKMLNSISVFNRAQPGAGAGAGAGEGGKAAGGAAA
ncbi:hypothetical protein JCM11251_000887 [Rhodosporidiobolus azoricus]